MDLWGVKKVWNDFCDFFFCLLVSCANHTCLNMDKSITHLKCFWLRDWTIALCWNLFCTVKWCESLLLTSVYPLSCKCLRTADWAAGHMVGVFQRLPIFQHHNKSREAYPLILWSCMLSCSHLFPSVCRYVVIKQVMVIVTDTASGNHECL